MGWFDKVATFVGAHGTNIQAITVERQQPTHVKFPVGDSVIKGQFQISFDKDAEVLAHITEFFVEKKHEDGREERVLLGVERHDAQNVVHGAEVNPPYLAKKGQVVKDGFCIIRVDIPQKLRELGYHSEADARRPELKFFVRMTADVKGTPMDADCVVPINVEV
jgi:hypothetical protein